MRGDRGEKGEKGDQGDRGINGMPFPDDHDLLVRIDQRIADIHDCIEDHEVRIRTLEKDQLKVLGAGAVTGFVSGWFSRLLNGGP